MAKRPNKIRLLYFLSVAAICTSCVWLTHNLFESPLLAALTIGVILLVPGRFVGFFWRELMVGRRYFEQKQFTMALEHFSKFKQQLDRHQLLNYLIWISPTFYTTSTQALVYNNLGCCYLESGELDQASNHFKTALQFDAKYPLPHFNLAVIEQLRKNNQQANYHRSQSIVLGFSNNAADKITIKAQQLYVRFETLQLKEIP